MKNATLLLLIFIVFAGCTTQASEKYKPDMEMTVVPSIADARSGQYSEPILITLRKTDSEKTPSEFTIALESPGTEDIAFYNELKELIAAIQTQTFKYPGDQNTYAVLIKGKKLGSSEYTPYALKVELDYKGERIIKKQLSARIS